MQMTYILLLFTDKVKKNFL